MTLLSKILGIPVVKELKLSKSYSFMYEHFLITAHNDLYLLIQEKDGLIDTLKFDFIQYKYGYPNDEVLGAHPYAKYGLGFYSCYVVENSSWGAEIKNANKIHPDHQHVSLKNEKHYIITFKDVTIDVLAKSFSEIVLTPGEVNLLIMNQLKFLKVD